MSARLALSSENIEELTELDLHQGSEIRSEHFYTASPTWTLYCLEHDRHLELVKQHAWHLLPPLLERRAWYHFLLFGEVPNPHDTEKLSRILLAPFLATNPTATELIKASRVALDDTTRRILLEISVD